MLFFSVLTHNDADGFINTYLGIAFAYFLLTIVFIFVTFGYIKELEHDQCECAGEFGPEILAIFAWVRILSFALALGAVLIMLYGHNRIVTMRKSTPKK